MPLGGITLLRRACLVVFILMLALGGAELAFRMLPVSQGYLLQNVNAAKPIARRLSERHAVISEGWRMRDPVRRYVNNEGFLHSDDFDRDGADPVVALIGDSQVEAPLVPEAETLQNRLSAAFDGRLRFYPVGMSGAALGQYTVWSEYLKRVYDPQLYVFLISANDFLESHERFALMPGFWYLRDGGDLVLHEYRRGLGSYISQYSHLTAYLLNNLHLPARIAALRDSEAVGSPDDAQAVLAGTAAQEHGSVDPATSALAAEAADWFIARLAQLEIPAERVVFVINPAEQGAYRRPVHLHPRDPAVAAGLERLRQRADEQGIPVLDLLPAFRESHLRDGVELEFPRDIHWTGAAHGVVADFLAGHIGADGRFCGDCAPR